MRYQTLAWFYDANDSLLHIKYLRFDANTPNREDNELFGGTDIDSFRYKIRSEIQKRIQIITESSKFYGDRTYEVPSWVTEFLCSAEIEMGINYHVTELFGFLTRGEPLSKIVVRHFIIDPSGRFSPHIKFTFKDCWLSEHKTQSESFSMKFSYCCLETHYYEGNRFATHERCKAIEPEPEKIIRARTQRRLSWC